MKRIAVFNVNWLGDALFTTPAIRALKKSRPEARIVSIGSPRSLPALANNPYLDGTRALEDRLGVSRFWEMVRLVIWLRRQRFDTAVFFSRSRTRAFLAWLAGIPRRVGYARSGGPNFLTHALRSAPKPVHKSQYFVDLAVSMGASPDGLEPDLHPGAQAQACARRLLSEAGIGPDERYAVVHAGGNWELKRWPAEHFVRWIRLFHERTKLRVVLCGSEAERPLIESIASKTSPAAVSLCGRTDLSTLAAVIKEARLVLSNDSGPIHVAASQSTPIVGVYGPTLASLTGPRSRGPVAIVASDHGCELPCYYTVCRDRVCMESLSVEAVLARSLELVR